MIMQITMISWARRPSRRETLRSRMLMRMTTNSRPIAAGANWQMAIWMLATTSSAQQTTKQPAAESTSARRCALAPGKPFAGNLAQAFVRDPSIVDFVVEHGVHFVTTSAGDPTKYTARLKEAGLVVFHVVPSLRAALKAVIQDRKKSMDQRFEAQIKLAEMPRNSSKTRIRNRCEITGRSRGFYRKLKLCRNQLRELASQGLIPGMTKSSW